MKRSRHLRRGVLFALAVAGACTFPDVITSPDVCVTDAECPEGLRCNAERTCVRCIEDGDCPRHCTPGDTECPRRCAPDGSCVGCLGDADCGEEHCSPEATCVGCLGDEDCPGGRCSPEQVCVPCLSDDDCGGDRCNEQHECVECLDDNDCESTERCAQEQCAPVHCVSLTTDGDETDVDCGGSCPDCPVGGACMEDGDCDQAPCIDNTCGCSIKADCQSFPGTYCAEGHCLPELLLGDDCESGDQCSSGFCNRERVCCSTACDGKCTSCRSILTGQPDGTCGPLPDGQDPFNDCPDVTPLVPRTCNGKGACNPLK